MKSQLHKPAAPRLSEKDSLSRGMRRLILASAGLFCASSLSLASPETDYEAAVVLLKRKGDPQALSQAVEALQKLADQNYVPALSTLGVFYAEGTGVPKDETQAVALLQRAVDQGFDKAQYNLGMIRLRKAHTAEEREAAMKLIEQAGEQGLPAAQKQLADIYYFGDHGIATNPDKAAAWARKGAERGDPASENLLGMLLERKGGNLPEAVSWFTKAAERGNTRAQANLGNLLISGRIQGADRVLGLAWLMVAAKRGEVLAENSLKDCLGSFSKEQIDAARQKARELSLKLAANNTVASL